MDESTIAARRFLRPTLLGAERIRAPLKALDRLLGNQNLHAGREAIYQVMARWLVRSKQPIIVIDWSDLKQNKSWHLLRAAILVGGRMLRILDMVSPHSQQGSRKTEGSFSGVWHRCLQTKPAPSWSPMQAFGHLGFVKSTRWAGIGWGDCAAPRISNPSMHPMSHRSG